MRSNCSRTTFLIAAAASLWLAMPGLPNLSAAEADKQAAQAKPCSKWALLIGVDSYLDTRLGKLNYCGADALALSDILVRQAKFPVDQVLVLHDKQEDAMRHPMRLAIQRALKAVLAQARAEDLVLVAFSGHGVHLRDTSYLCPADADRDEPAATMIAVPWLYAMLQKECKAAQKLVLIDACRKNPQSGPRAPGDVMSRSLADSLRHVPEGLLVLSSCKADQLSYEDQSVGHGVFMNYVLEGLSGKADQRGPGLPGNGNGTVDIDELFNYAAIQTGKFVLKQFTESQTPEKYGVQAGGPIELAQAGNDAREFAQKALAALNGLDDTHIKGDEMARLAAVHFRLGDKATANRICREAIGTAQKLGIYKDTVLEQIGSRQLIGGDPQGALATLRLASNNTESILEWIVKALAQTGDFSEAMRMVRDLNGPSGARAFAAIAIAQHRRGDKSGARRALAEAREKILQSGDPDFLKAMDLVTIANAQAKW